MEESNSAINYLVDELKNAQSHENLKSNLEAWKKITGFDWYLFALNRSESMQVSEHIIISNYPTKWIQKYEREKLYVIDPVVKYVVNHQNAIFWDSFTDLDGYNSREQTEFLKLAAKYGLETGCSIPCNSYGNFAVFSMASKSSSTLLKMNEYLPLNHIYANQLSESVLRISAVSNTNLSRDDFSEREVECLLWGSEGKTSWEISQILGISERTVVFHFTNAAAKLGAANRQHAISKSLMYGIVKPSV